MSDSTITKRAIAASLKELTKRKAFDKITIHEITEFCGLNRQTFYYHFKDKYELVDWIYYNETISIIMQDLTYENWDQKVLLMLKNMKQDKYFYESTLKLSVESGFRNYLFRIATELFMDIVGRIELNTDYLENEKTFISEFYAFGIVEVIISWAQHGMRETPEYITKQLVNVAQGTKKFAANRFLEDQTDICRKENSYE